MTTDTAVIPPQDRQAQPVPGGVVWTMRISALIVAGGVLLQPFWIGMFMSGNVNMIMIHSVAAMLIVLAAVVNLVAAILVRRRGWKEALPHTIGLLIGLVLQTGFGMMRLLWAHYPIGVLMAIGAIGMVTMAWKLPLRTGKTSVGGEA